MICVVSDVTRCHAQSEDCHLTLVVDLSVVFEFYLVSFTSTDGSDSKFRGVCFDEPLALVITDGINGTGSALSNASVFVTVYTIYV